MRRGEERKAVEERTYAPLEDADIPEVLTWSTDYALANYEELVGVCEGHESHSDSLFYLLTSEERTAVKKVKCDVVTNALIEQVLCSAPDDCALYQGKDNKVVIKSSTARARFLIALQWLGINGISEVGVEHLTYWYLCKYEREMLNKAAGRKESR